MDSNYNPPEKLLKILGDLDNKDVPAVDIGERPMSSRQLIDEVTRGTELGRKIVKYHNLLEEELKGNH